ncbi:MAG TPA: UDP-N-acetylglucosamine 1-carboxyvinyltransferase [Bacillota bacterium]|nr:UDP-N-acetylglucosamine 1-carboxyvinyltransferase [Bacillota bacterium]HOH10196.1 UDP-N-acetylglucosamine 1-carboxyvinyltransferase [Bacillota bacterium]HOS51079.1 UDP-N-acetylglucosamine 1-carboxyvinyltransferase [Bacillota bacterium]HOY89391.1 UDP-N-acetylglucosamine 1-carboxyvinyltransferase [Bacillota bacterium]HPI01158.1 UDP-N-acetylglucosamine 1-carboxyvinyltransferase [Bacillota bacterium]
MNTLVVEGGRKISGTVRVGGAKNSSLPLIAAALLTAGTSTIEDVPRLKDIETMRGVVEALGARVIMEDNVMTVDSSSLNGNEPPYDLVRAMRASFLVMGPLLARMGSAHIFQPGGCAIGARPIDLHLKGFAALGAEIDMSGGVVKAKVSGRLKGERVYLDFPSVGATENIMMAAATAEGRTLIENAAREPEIVDLANFLNKMGAKVRGAGTPMLRIDGVDTLVPSSHTVIPDRIEAGTFMIIAAGTQGSLYIDNVVGEHVKPLEAKLSEAGAHVETFEGAMRVSADKRLKAVDVTTMPYPGFPTDMQAQLMAVLCTSEGTSQVTENVFENRFMHAPELSRMGANIKISGRTAIIEGVPTLTGAQVNATDLRASAALVTAALTAEGETHIHNISHLDRGYENFEGRLAKCGARMRRE